MKQTLSNKLLSKCGFNAFSRIRLIDESKYIIVSFENTHNHELLWPDLVKYLKCGKRLSGERRHRIDLIDRAGIGMSKTMSCFVVEDNSYDNFSFTR